MARAKRGFLVTVEFSAGLLNKFVTSFRRGLQFKLIFLALIILIHLDFASFVAEYLLKTSSFLLFPNTKRWYNVCYSSPRMFLFPI